MKVWVASSFLEELKLGKGKCPSEDVEPAGQRSMCHSGRETHTDSYQPQHMEARIGLTGNRKYKLLNDNRLAKNVLNTPETNCTRDSDHLLLVLPMHFI